MKVISFFVPNSLDNFNYIVFDEKTLDAYIFDPYDAKLIINHIEQNRLNPKGILLTHYHHDHVKGVKELSEKYQISEIMFDDKHYLNSSDYLQKIYVPGHTLDHVVFLGYSAGRQEFLISGDTIFNAGIGNIKNGGEINQYFESIQNLQSIIHDETIIYPSHNYRDRNLKFTLSIEKENESAKKILETKYFFTNWKNEKEINLFLRIDRTEIQQYLKTSNSKETFIKLRSLRDQW